MKKILIAGLTGILMLGGFGSIFASAQGTLPTDSAWKFSKNLYFGMRGSSDVSDLQEFLTDQGYYGGPVTGNYFLLTTQAVRKFQSAQGLTPTGYFGVKSRGAANAILEKLFDVICPEEEGCVPDSLPEPQLSISTESSLAASPDKPFTAIFRVGGGDGKYAIQAEGSIPGLHFTRNECPPGVYCIKGEDPDMITLTGIPEQTGVFPFTILARDPETRRYGKASFALIVPGESGTAPIIQGVKGPVSLLVGEQGTWTLGTSAKSGKSLSYFVSWGDDFGMANGQAASDKMAPRVSQTATFSHSYSRPGTYTALFRVVNEKGLSAETSLSVQVTGENAPIGTLEIQPSSLKLAVGESATLTAMYQPPMPTCLGGMACPLAMPAPYQVSASWSSSDPKVVTMALTAKECTVTPNNQAICPPSVGQASGLASGNAVITAVYTLSTGQKAKATAPVAVTGENAPIGTLEIQPSSLKLAVGESATLTAMYQPPMPTCPIGIGIMCKLFQDAPYQVSASWSSSDPKVATILIATDCGVTPNNQAICPPPVVQASGLASGNAVITAVYTLSTGQKVKATAPVVVASRTAGIVYSAATNKSAYRSDERIEITVTARNTSPEAKTLNFKSGCQAAYAILPAYESKNTTMCTMAFTSVTLMPNEAKAWTLVHSPDTYRLPAGEYKLVGEVIGHGTASAPITVY